MQVMLNGEPTQIADASSVQMLLEQLGLKSNKVAIERNAEIVPRSLYGSVSLMDGDQIEIVQFIGGG